MELSGEDSILELAGVTVTYKMPRGIAKVVDGVDLKVNEGEVLGLIGESGSGKSMLASAIMRVVPPPGITTGSIIFKSELLNGKIDLLKLPLTKFRQVRWKELAMVFQGAMNSFNPTIRIKEHFLDTASAHGWHDRGEVLEKASKLLELVRLEPGRVLDSFPHELSGGMKQRALIALSLLLDPRLLILDEPTSALDTVSQRVILDVLKDIYHRLKLTMIFITHDVPIIAGLAQRVAIMYAFKVVEVGPIEEIFRAPVHPYTRGLLSTIPSLTTDIDEIKPIPGRHPDPINPPPGCRFHPRCPYRDEKCMKEEPSFIEVKPGHFVLCHKALEIGGGGAS
ncbi:MAG: dipeptide/oligopeptide/nickel ABC transporter ATP-binding protein [Thermofilum sp. ex4484_15]|nr:MAG: dipeptide/oligopeptide/nickel ABC transporter ATP-binding protein [Thermofilum sp. ex4484_15]